MADALRSWALLVPSTIYSPTPNPRARRFIEPSKAPAVSH